MCHPTKINNEPAPAPEYLFQHNVADMFQKHGSHYIAYADRLTAFIELVYFLTNTKSTLIIYVLHKFFHRWGVPEEITMHFFRLLTLGN